MKWLKPEAAPSLLRVASIVDIAAELGPEPEGEFFVARCPFPGCGQRALVLDPLTNRHHCAACGAQGNVIGLAIALHHLTFMGALRFLAERAGLDFAGFLTEQCECTACSRRRHTKRVSEVPSWALTPLPTLRLVSRGGR
jgi:DNA primase